MRLVQFRDSEGRRAVAANRSPAPFHVRLADVESVYELALETIESTRSLADVVATYLGNETVDIAEVERSGRLLAPLEHPVPTRCWVTSASGPGPEDGPEVPSQWNFRGNGSTLVAGGQPVTMPTFARGAAPCPSIAGLYIIAEDGTPCQLGWALGHAVTDPVLAAGPGAGHAALRPSAVGPEILLGELPTALTGHARILRGESVLAEHVLVLGADVMTRSFSELAREHFRYGTHRRPGDVHVHFFGTGQIAPPQAAAQPGDVFEFNVPPFGQPLRNPLAVATANTPNTPGTPSIRVL